MEKSNKTIWKTIKKYVDLETGEMLTPKKAIENYYIVRKNKKVYQPNRTKSTKVIIYTNECRRKPTQQQLWK
jgi:hypothetical protein